MTNDSVKCDLEERTARCREDVIECAKKISVNVVIQSLIAKLFALPRAFIGALVIGHSLVIRP